MLILLENHGNSVKAINLGVAVYPKGTICYQPMRKDYEVEFFFEVPKCKTFIVFRTCYIISIRV